MRVVGSAGEERSVITFRQQSAGLGSWYLDDWTPRTRL